MEYPISLDDSLRTKVKLRYTKLLEKLLEIPLKSTYYNTRLMLWIKKICPELIAFSDISAFAIVQYLVKMYAALTDNNFLFQETNRKAFVARLKPLKSKNYLLQYLANELETLPPQKCHPFLFEEVATLIDKCLHTTECLRIVEEALFVDILPELIKNEFNQQWLQDVETQYITKKTLKDTLLSQIEMLENNFFELYRDKGTAAYLNAVAKPLAFLNSANALGKVSQGFKVKVRGGVFEVKDLSSETLNVRHLWPELAVMKHRLTESGFNYYIKIACDAIQQEIQTLLDHPPDLPERKGEEPWELNLVNLEQMCANYDLEDVVFYYIKDKFVCFRETEVLNDIARGETQKYPVGFVAKMKERANANAPPHPPVIGAVSRVEVSRQKGGNEQEGNPSAEDIDDMEMKFNC